MICESNTEVVHASIAWGIEPTNGDRYRIIIRSVCVEGVDIDAKTLTKETIECLRDVVRESSEYDPTWLSGQADEWNKAAWEDSRADQAMDDRRIGM